MNKEEKEAIVEMFSKLATMKYTYLTILNTAKTGVNAIVKKAGVSRIEMAKLRAEGERRSRKAIRANEHQKNKV